MAFTGRSRLRHSSLLIAYCLLLIALSGVFLFVPVLASSHEQLAISPLETNEVIVQWKPNRARTVPFTVSERDSSTIPNVEVLEFSSQAKAAEALAKLEKNPSVAYAEPNKRSVRPAITPNDPQYANQWGLLKTHADIAWDVEQGLSQVSIAFVDTGVNGLHEDLNGKVLAGKSFVGELETDLLPNTDSDNCDHGTGVASVAAAATGNGKGVAGVAWEPKILPVKVIDLPSPCTGDLADLAEGIRYAADAGAKIINISLGATDDSATVYNAVTYAQGKGALIVAASGNDSTNKVNYPAAYPKVIAVGATDQNDAKPAFSNSGVDLDIVAPGVSIPNAKDSLLNNEYQSSSGTSVATPHVSGLAALLLSRNPGMAAQDLYDAIIKSADKVSGMNGNAWTVQYGWGRLNARSTLEQFRDYHAQWVSQNSYPTIERGKSAQFTVTFKNTGKTIWKQSDPLYPVHLGTSHSMDRIPGWIRSDTISGNSSGWLGPNRIEMIDGSVTPGSNGTFTFFLSAPQNKEFGVFREYFQPVADFSNWMEDWGVYWEVTVPTELEKYQYDYISQNFNTTNVKRGGSITFTLTLKNTGTATWVRDTVNLGTDRSMDRIPGWIRSGGTPSGWLKDNRVQMVEPSVAPGVSGNFEFYMTVPGDKAFGTYREYFRPVADGIGWMRDLGIYWEIVVTE